MNDYPKGYPSLATFLDSDEGFTVYRRFGYLQSRLLLKKQEELRCLEDQLDALEQKMIEDDDQRFCRSKVFGPNAEKHKNLLVSIESKFCSYGTYPWVNSQILLADADSSTPCNCSTDDGIQQAR